MLIGFFTEAATPDVRACVEAALAKLAAAGATVDAIAPPASFADVIANHRRIMAIDAAAHHRHNFPERRGEYGPCIAALMDEGLAATVVEYAEALAHQKRFARDLELKLAGYDALVTPATTTTAPGLETTGDPRFNAPFSYAGLPTVCFRVACRAWTRCPWAATDRRTLWGGGAFVGGSMVRKQDWLFRPAAAARRACRGGLV